MGLAEGIGIGNILISLLIVICGFAYRSIMARIDKLEEVSRRDDEAIEKRGEKEMDRRIQNVVDLFGKIDGNYKEIMVEIMFLWKEVMFLKGKSDSKKDKEE